MVRVSSIDDYNRQVDAALERLKCEEVVRKLGLTYVKFETKDSGQRQEFATGSRRDSREGKGRYDLLPVHAVARLAQLFERGAVKYGDRNWEKGQPLSRYLDSALRHAFQALDGREDEDHLAGAVWNLMAAIETQHRVRAGELPAELDDLVKSRPANSVDKANTEVQL